MTAAAAPAATILLAKLARFDGIVVDTANTDTQTTFVLEAPSAKRACRAALVIFEKAAPKAEIRAITIERLP
ncbi:MAG: hypothetical protein ACYDA0_14955 [Candidatus Dormibacteraceae bacterium]